ncbi:MAG: SPFH domain-containing protein [Planctomycetota bacterium]|nr:SPFH domain-containing protein [Planctomycetota bacterium]
MKTFGILALGLLVVAALLLYMCTYVTEYNELTIVKTFGKPGPAYNGGEGGAGLRFKAPAPIQSVVRYDARLRVLVNEPKEVAMTGSGHIIVTLNCTWRIKDPATFLNKLETEAKGQTLLRSLLDQKGVEVIAAVPLTKLIRVRVDTPGAPAEADAQEDVEREILSRLAPEAAANGIQVTTVGIQALGFSQDVTKEVINSQKAERDAKATGIINEGETAKKNIITQAKLDADVVLAFAEGRAQQIRTLGFQRSASLYEQFREKPELAEFLRKLRMIERAFRENSVIYVDSSMIDSLKMLYERASLPGQGPATKPAPAPEK